MKCEATNAYYSEVSQKLVLNYILPLVTTCNNLWSPKGVALGGGGGVG